MNTIKKSRALPKKIIKQTVENLYNHWFNRVPVSIMKLSEISNAIEAIYLSDVPQENKYNAYALLVEKYRIVPQGGR